MKCKDCKYFKSIADGYGICDGINFGFSDGDTEFNPSNDMTIQLQDQFDIREIYTSVDFGCVRFESQ